MSDQHQPGPMPPNPGGPPPPPPPGYPTYPAQPGPPAGTPQGHGAPYGPPPGYPPYGASVMPYASWLRRVGGYLVDYLLLIPGYVVGGIGESIAGDSSTSSSESLGLVIAAVGYLGSLGVFVWNQVLRQGRTGQSVGKQVVGTRLIREDNGLPLGGWLTFGRYLLHILDALPCYLGFLWPLWDAKRQTFADKIVKSVVLHEVVGRPF